MPKFCLLLSLLLSFTIQAEDFKSVLFSKLTLEVDDPLTESSWMENWKKAKGKFYFKNDAIVGEELPEEHHVAGAGRIIPMSSGVIQIEFRLDNSDMLQFGHDFSSEDKKDHLMRVAITKAGKLSVKAGLGWGPTTKMEPVGKPVPIKVEEGKWHTATVEFHRQKIVVHFDHIKVFEGEATANQDVEKNRIALQARGLVSFRNVKFWQGEVK